MRQPLAAADEQSIREYWQGVERCRQVRAASALVRAEARQVTAEARQTKAEAHAVLQRRWSPLGSTQARLRLTRDSAPHQGPPNVAMRRRPKTPGAALN